MVRFLAESLARLKTRYQPGFPFGKEALKRYYESKEVQVQLEKLQAEFGDDEAFLCLLKQRTEEYFEIK